MQEENSKQKKIIGFSSIRSDFDLLKNLYVLLDQDDEIDLKLVISGANLSTTYGLNAAEIRNSNISILAEIESLLDSDSKQARIKSAGILLLSLVDLIAFEKPDLLIFAGDREDVIIYALLGGYLQIPTLHFFGGDHVEDGHIDNPVRHATSKLSTLHCVTLNEHKERLMQIGESEKRICVTGAISLDRFYSHQKLSKEEVLEELNLGRKGIKEYAIVIFHPQDVEIEHSHLYFRYILDTLKNLGLFAMVSYPNIDPGNKNIIQVINDYSVLDKDYFFYKNLSNDLFLSVYKNAIIQIGNSSAGIIESASIPIPVVNVGIRQVGRKANSNVIFCDTTKKDIEKAIKKALSKEFSVNVRGIKNIYGDGKSAIKAYEFIKSTEARKYIFKIEDPLK